MRSLILVWAALLALLMLSAGVSLMQPSSSLSEVSGLAIALAKTLLVLFFFMELRLERWAMRAVAAAAALMFLILLGGTLQDYHSRAANAAPAASPGPGVTVPPPGKTGRRREDLRMAGFE